MKKFLPLFFKKFKADGLVVTKVPSIKSILSKIRDLFLSKSGPFLLSGSKNHWANFVLGFSSLSSCICSLESKSAWPAIIKSGL